MKLSLGDGTMSGLTNLVWSSGLSNPARLSTSSAAVQIYSGILEGCKRTKELSFIVIRFMTFPLMFDIWEG